MAVHISHAQRMIGRTCVARCHDGRTHVGVVRRVTRDGIYMQPLGGAGAISAEAGTQDITTADRPQHLEAEEAFWPFLFLPFLALAALSPWGWGGYGYGGYGGYWW